MQSVNLNFNFKSLADLSGDVSLLPNKTYKLIIDYPVNGEINYNIKVGSKGMSGLKLLSRIYKTYLDVYDCDGLVWGHELCQLFLEGIFVDHKKLVIRLAVGS